MISTLDTASYQSKHVELLQVKKLLCFYSASILASDFCTTHWKCCLWLKTTFKLWVGRWRCKKRSIQSVSRHYSGRKPPPNSFQSLESLGIRSFSQLSSFSSFIKLTFASKQRPSLKPLFSIQWQSDFIESVSVKNIISRCWFPVGKNCLLFLILQPRPTK